MAGNSNLHMSKAAQADEFYTTLKTVEDEMRHYRKYFKGACVFLNADDPYESNFFRYFELNFLKLGLRKLISTHFDPDKPTYKLELTGDITGDGKVDRYDVVKTDLRQNGDFRSDECRRILEEEADIVITNPPFSLMKEYLPMLVNSGKKFLVLGNQNHITYKENFPYFLDGKVWLGYNHGHFWFKVPDYYEPKKTDYKEDEDGQKWRRMGNICWFTNMDIKKRHDPIDLYKKYDPAEYPKYDTYDAIECGEVSKLPYDTDKIIGVPVSYMAYHCPEQFEILGCSYSYGDIGEPYHHKEDSFAISVNGKNIYKRIFIRNITLQEEQHNGN